MNNLPAELDNARARRVEIRHFEVRERSAVAGAGPALVQARRCGSRAPTPESAPGAASRRARRAVTGEAGLRLALKQTAAKRRQTFLGLRCRCRPAGGLCRPLRLLDQLAALLAARDEN